MQDISKKNLAVAQTCKNHKQYDNKKNWAKLNNKLNKHGDGV